MKIYANKLNLLLSLTMLLGIALACGGDQLADANKLVDDANKSIEDARALMGATEDRNTKLFNERIQNLAQFVAYRSKMSLEAKSIIEDYGKVADKATDASKKFADAQKLNIPDKYKEYLDLKSKEFAKRAEGITVRKGKAQAFLDTNNPIELPEFIDKNDTKFKSIMSEAEDLGNKADKIKQDNKEIFKS